MSRTGLVFHTTYLRHETGEHPEERQRLGIIMESLEKCNILEHLVPICPRKASVEEIQLIHDTDYINRIESFSERGGGNWDEETVLSKDSFSAALLAAGGVLAAVDSVLDEKVDNAFALVRPPGMHATIDRAKGFCLFNNVAIAARYAQTKYNLQKILIINLDAHHANGIQEIFYEDSGVLYFSIHQEGLFPYEGSTDEVGQGPGEGFNVNVPVPKGTGDAGYFYILNKILNPIALQYNPQMILIACGVDGHFYDYMSNLEVTTKGFAMIMEIIKDIANKTCDGKIVSILEGGYNFESLGTSIAAIINVMGDFGREIEDSILPPVNVFTSAARIKIDKAIEEQKKYWDL